MALRIKGNTPAEPAEESQPKVAPAEEPTALPEEAAIPEVSPGMSDPGMLPMAGGGQVSPEVARYFGPEGICANCRHYTEPGACEIVSGPIDPDGRCNLFDPDQMDEAAPMGAAMPTETPNAPIPPEA